MLLEKGGLYGFYMVLSICFSERFFHIFHIRAQMNKKYHLHYVHSDISDNFYSFNIYFLYKYPYMGDASFSCLLYTVSMKLKE